MKLTHALLACGLLLSSGCVFSDVQPLSRDTFQVSSTAAPVCGTAGAREVARQIAMIEVIRRGGDRYIILGNQTSESSGGVIYNPYTAIPTVTAMSRSNQDIIVKVLSPGDPDYANGLSARETLGPNWQEIVAAGAPESCS